MEQLEKDILDWIGRNNACEALRTQLAGAILKKRDYMPTGFFIYLDPPDNSEPVPDGLRVRCPDLQAPELMHGAGSSLFFRNGLLHYLELYAKGGFFPRILQHYSLQPPNE